MAVKLLRHRRFADGSIGLLIHIDTARTLADGSLDPAWLRPFRWPPRDTALYPTAADYVAFYRRETRALVQEELARLADEGLELPGEGDDL